jgi:recombination protein RecR
MSSTIPKPLEDLIEAFRSLPGVGSRTAERYAYYLLKSDSVKSEILASSLKDLGKKIKHCPVTFALIDSNEDLSPLYKDSRRDKQQVAVVADPFDIVALEKTNTFKGTYHVLGGLVSPIDNIGPEQLHLNELLHRIDKDAVKEIILATNASVEGESTALLITKLIGERPVKITRLARGLPVGVDIEYADQITLTRALEGRQAV